MGSSTSYKAVVIGSGQGGVPLAMALASHGERTALIEMGDVGGSCINYGCTPTKTMVASARVAHQAARGDAYGVSGLPQRLVVDMKRVRERKRNIVASFRSGSERRIEGADNLTLIRGAASFVGPHEITVTGDNGHAVMALSAEKVFINTGTRPALPDIQGLQAVPYLTNRTIMELDSVPEHLLIVGGGYIGVEFAQMFRRFGAEVTLIHRGVTLLGREDTDVSKGMAAILDADGVHILLESEPVSVSTTGSDGPGIERGLELHVRTPRGTTTLEGTHLLLAAGRVPCTDMLGPERAGIATDRQGSIRVNDRLETSVSDIWALGDVKGGPAFTHISYDDYRIIVRNLYGDGKGTTAGRMVPYTVFTDPQLGRIGLSEEAALAAGRNIRVAKMPMEWVARALEVDETRGFMKAVVDGDSGEILGFSMIGMEAGEIAGAVQIAMMGKLRYTDIRDATFSHPTLMESLNNLFAGMA